jgi:polyphosphate kinase
MGEFRCELLSADQLASLASGPLPNGIPADVARRSLHRDMYLDTHDDVLRQRGIVCRLRADAEGNGSLSLRIANGNGPVHVETPTRSSDVARALSENTDVVRRLRGIIDPSALVVRADLEVDRLSRSAARDWLRRPKLEVHLDRVTIRANGTSASFLQLCAHQLRGDGDDELIALQRAIEEEHGLRVSRVTARERAELAMKWSKLEGVPRTRAYSDHLQRVAVTLESSVIPEFLNAELSLLSFQRRVLTIAADPKTPLRERLRFLAIVSSNIDEFFMVRMGVLYADADASMATVASDVVEATDDGFSPVEQLNAVLASVSEICARQSEIADQCITELARHGTFVTPWEELDAEQKATLRARFREEIQPLLTPFAMTLSPGHPLPRLVHLSLGIATILRSGTEGLPRFSEVELPASLPRFFSIPDKRGRAVVSLEEIVRANLDLVHPGMTLDQAYVFRVTRSAELELDELHADDLLNEVERATARRDQGAAVRLEVERGMPPVLRSLLLEDLRRERGESGPLISDIEEVEGLVDLRGLAHIDLPAEGSLSYPPIRAARLFASAPSMCGVIARGDVLVHHPFESFADSVVRFVHDAAADPDVLAIKTTLYRIGNPSPIADALLEAARAGKQVSAFVELKARFDEDVNIGWSRALEAAGGHVVRGLVGLKNHAKTMLVVRREGSEIKRYAHVGTGNYNVRSGEQYTDLSLFTCDEDITTDVANLFNELTGAASAPQQQPRVLLVAPHHLLPGILQRIEREAAHARAGHNARIVAKLNGLSDPDVVRALCRASRDGVRIDLVVRGICTLRPGVARRSDRIRVTSVVGRFLEHSRIYKFANAGNPEYFIGSADLRPRNLRRRVEVLTPIREAAHRAKIDGILDAYLNDPTAWELGVDGEYAQRRKAGKSAQESFNPASS